MILTPTRELANQILNVVEKLVPPTRDLKYRVFCGGIPKRLDIKALNSGVDLAICTPGRLNDLMNDDLIDLSTVDTMIFDETDEMLKIGFQKEIDSIIDRIKYSSSENKTQVILFSATVPTWVKNTSKDFMSKDRKVVDLVHTGEIQTSTSVSHYKIYTPNSKEKIDCITNLLNSFVDPNYKVIVFCNTRGMIHFLGERDWV